MSKQFANAFDPNLLLNNLLEFKKGNFEARLPTTWGGVEGQIATAFNETVSMVQTMAKEFARIGKSVGKEGEIEERIILKTAEGAWQNQIKTVNTLITDLVQPMDQMSRIISAVSSGDLTQSMPLKVNGRVLKGAFLGTAQMVNTVVKQLSSFASEVTRVAREVGTEGKLGSQAEVIGLARGGTWKDLTENVNMMASNLTSQVRNIAEVTTAVANGDLSKKITVEVQGEIFDLKQTINTMVDQLNSFASEVVRVAREVGTEGKLGGQAEVKGIAGTWKDLTENVNMMASNLTSQIRNIAEVTTAVANGDLTRKITVDVKGEISDLKKMINTMVDQLNSFASEVVRVAREVGIEGKLGGQADVKGVAGTWKDLTENVNMLASNLTSQVRNIAEVTTAVANGDLSKKITVEVQGEIFDLKQTINIMVDQLNSFASEVVRVAREVGTEGKLGGQADVKGVAGTWKDLTENVNMMASNLTSQVRNIAEVTTAVANGNLSKKITVDVQGEIFDLKQTINTMVDQLNSFASEVIRVAREVGTEGKLGGQAEVKGVAGTWKDLTENVNMMASNLTSQVRNIAEVTTAVANGDLTRTITVDVKGEISDLKKTINTMVDQLNSFASEVVRVAREVGIEGKLGGQADVKGVAGTWKDLTENVNMLASNLTSQVRNIAEVTTAVANGDLSKKITVEVQGEIFDLKQTINIMVDQLNSFASEVVRVAREVGTEGKLGGQADVKGVAGTWKDLTENVNMMASNLTSQVRNIADVTTAVANGDLSKKITVEVQGEIFDLKQTINTMVDQLNSFASEVTRVSREAGIEGKLGGQADVKGVAGTWKGLTENVNMMASNLTNQVRNIAEVTTAVAMGDLSKKITVDVRGEFLQLKDTINTMVDQLRAFASEVTRVAREVGTEGKLGGQAYVQGVAGTWKDLTENVNQMAGNLTSQVRNIAAVTTAVANGDLSKKITVDAKGEIFELKNTINTMVDQLSSFAAEVTRVAREVGTEGKLGGQAVVKGVGGIWKDFTENVNQMASNLTEQVRGIAKVVTAVAQGDLKKKLSVQAKGEVATLSETINNMIDTLATFAEQVTSVAREVGVEGRLGGQASVPGASGTWKDLTDNVNQLAANLTNQVRAISEVATAVTKGDLTRTIRVDAQGEVAALKDIINEMIFNLKETTLKNAEQDWLKTNLAKFTRILQGQKNLVAVAQLILSELAPMVTSQHALFYLSENISNEPVLKMLAAYAFKERKNLSVAFRLGEGLVGQCAYEKERILLTNVPDDYIRISSGLGERKPVNIVVLPVLFEGQVKAIIELGSFEPFTGTRLALLDQLPEIIGIVLNSIETNSRTEELLKQSQSMAQELQSQQEELQNTNAELEDKAKLLAAQNTEVARKNHEVEVARRALEEKAEQLALTSKYKSEFLANMSHELRTPLNSLLILSRQLADNVGGNLTAKQIEFGKTIHASGIDLLNLINDILDLSKIESGTVSIEIEPVKLKDIYTDIDRTFRHIAENKGLAFNLRIASNLPKFIETDTKRLQQVLKNLLSNACKFTSKGSVTLEISIGNEGWHADHPTLSKTDTVIAFAVIDTGIGIPPEKNKIIFEAFQQVDATSSRKYGGTGLGLSISREIAFLLGGEITVQSELGKGSIFTFYLPQKPLSFLKNISSKNVPQVINSSPIKLEPVIKADLSSLTNSDLFIAADDRTDLKNEENVILIVEDDVKFANLLLNITHENGFKCIVTSKGEEAIKLVKQYNPIAILLDLHLPDISGKQVIKYLKNNLEFRHIPIYVLTVEEDKTEKELILKQGVHSIFVKPVTQESIVDIFNGLKRLLEQDAKRLLVIEDNKIQRDSIVELLGGNDVKITEAADAKETLELLQNNHFDCIILDLNLPGVSGFQLLEKISKNKQWARIPVVIYTGIELSAAEINKLEKVTKSIIVKDVNSLEHLLDVTSIFLHRVHKNMSDDKRQMVHNLHQSNTNLNGKTVLVVDDDVRNIFAITSVLEGLNLKVLSVECGEDALKILKNRPDIDLVLMDIMMPEMDGYETIKQIRKQEKFKGIPILALTAKAMAGDREKCLEVGATDYISKPLDIDRLVIMLKEYLASTKSLA